MQYWNSWRILIRFFSYVMCNYYKCNINVFDKVFQSSEQAYQWRFVNYLGLENFAQEIMNASTTNEAKEIASRVPRDQHKDWHSIKCQMMKEILREKSDYNNNNNCLKSNIQCIEIRVQWTVHYSPLFRSALLCGNKLWSKPKIYFGHLDYH